MNDDLKVQLKQIGSVREGRFSSRAVTGFGAHELQQRFVAVTGLSGRHLQTDASKAGIPAEKQVYLIAVCEVQ